VGTTQFMVGDFVADTIVNRMFTINGDTNITDADVAVVMCDFNDDGVINVIDKANFNTAYKGSYSIYADFNNDGTVNVIDKANFNTCYKGGGNGIVYGTSLHFE
jgi:hypothetical protein